ncbi:MAG: type II toxin-antitoxin system RelE/ParE family toxin [Deltaproteobacteria bacterium]|nr:type II toxin-antitoxin system RelE/ParE family toxin [Deltaproteobacteria bacterium]
MAIRSFGDKTTADFFLTGKVRKTAKWKSIKRIARRKLDMLHYAEQLCDLMSPPSNRLEKLKGGLKTFYSIRINDQWRIIFRWTDLGPDEVNIVDYHK